MSIRLIKRFEGGGLFACFCRQGLYYMEPKGPNQCLINASAKGKATELRPLRVIETRHPSTHEGFRPTMAEVLAQIPAADRAKVVAFELCGVPRSDTGCYFAKIRLYTHGHVQAAPKPANPNQRRPGK